MNEATPQVSPKKSPLIGYAVLALALLGAVGVFAYQTQQQQTPTPEVVTASPESSMMPLAEETESPTVMEQGAYKDGEYQVTGNYVSPGGPEQIDVTLTLEDSVITDIDVVSKAQLPMSVKFQGEFIGGYKEFVLGKNIEQVQLTKVAGSSLTPKGFQDALNQVKEQARV